MLVVDCRFPGHANKQWALSKCFSHTEGQGSPLGVFRKALYGKAANGVSGTPLVSLFLLVQERMGWKSTGCTSLPRVVKVWDQSILGTRPHSDLYLSLPVGGLVWVCFCPGSFRAPEQPCLVPHRVQLRRSIRIIRVVRA